MKTNKNTLTKQNLRTILVALLFPIFHFSCSSLDPIPTPTPSNLSGTTVTGTLPTSGAYNNGSTTVASSIGGTTVSGTSGSSIISGTSGSSIISGTSGSSIISGTSGSSIISGTSGSSIISSTSSNNSGTSGGMSTLVGANSNDIIIISLKNWDLR